MSTVVVNCASVCDVSTQQQTPTSTEQGTVAPDSRPYVDSLQTQLRLSLSHLSALSYTVADKACLTRTIAALAEPLTEMHRNVTAAAKFLQPVSCKHKFGSAGSALRRWLNALH